MAQQPAIEHSSLGMTLKRVDRVYRPNESVEGTVTINAKTGWSHSGIVLRAEGGVFLQQTSRGLGLLDAMANSTRTVTLLQEEVEIAPAGRVPEGKTEIPFEFVLSGSSGQPLMETYHGVYVNVFFLLSVECERGSFKKALKKEIEFIVEVPSPTQAPASSVESFEFTQALSKDGAQRANSDRLPRFKISGKLHRSVCPINLPFTGEIVVEESEAPIKSIELQLVRVETVKTEAQENSEATEIQNIQIADGDPARGIAIPIYIVFPRLFACPVLVTPSFSVEFDLNILVVTEDRTFTENFSICPYRSS